MLQKLSLSILEKKITLPEKPVPVILYGKYVRLEPLVIERDASHLFVKMIGNSE